MPQAAADILCGRYCISLESAYAFAVWHWYIASLRANQPLQAEDCIDYLAAPWRRRLPDKRHQQALAPFCENVARSRMSLLEAMAQAMVLTRSIVDYGSQYFQVMVGYGQKRGPAARRAGWLTLAASAECVRGSTGSIDKWKALARARCRRWRSASAAATSRWQIRRSACAGQPSCETSRGHGE